MVVGLLRFLLVMTTLFAHCIGGGGGVRELAGAPVSHAHAKYGGCGALLLMRMRGGSGLAGSSKVEGPSCMGCGKEVVERIVQKASANKGRPFYKCRSPAGPRCNSFFQWADEAPKQAAYRPGPSAAATSAGGGRGLSPPRVIVPMPPSSAASRTTHIDRVPRADGDWCPNITFPSPCSYLITMMTTKTLLFSNIFGHALVCAAASTFVALVLKLAGFRV
jgi:hypothetical protein